MKTRNRKIPSSHPRARRASRVLRPCLLLALGLLLALLWAGYVALRVEAAGARDEARQADAIVVLGAAQYEGWPSPVFRARLDHALKLYESGMAPLVVVVGGGGAYTEADAGARYLESRSLPPGALVAVERGDSTYASLEEVEALAGQEGIGSVLLVSDRFHMFRSLAMARDLGLRAYGSPTATSPIEESPLSRFRHSLREVAAYTAYVVVLA